jgi:L-alanine-DL-glutamate epimerase-like enolase superfamily enzyme
VWPHPVAKWTGRLEASIVKVQHRSLSRATDRTAEAEAVDLKIARAGFSALVMAKDDPTWRFALGARPDSRGFVLRLDGDDGSVGFGLASEVPHMGHTLGGVEAALQAAIPAVVGADPCEWRSVAEAARRAGCEDSSACGAVETALIDLASRHLRLPAHRLLGGAFRRSVPVLRIVALKAPPEVAASAAALVAEGCRYLKIKLDNESLDLDAARVAAVREAVGDGVHLTLDANQSYSPKAAVELYRRVERYGIDLFEQPVPARDFSGLKQVTDAVGCVVEADEAAASLEDVARLVDLRAADSISLKLVKLGGVDALQRAAALCLAGHVRCRLGAHVGSRLLSAAALHFAAATPNIDYACELGEFARLRDDPFRGLEVRDGAVELPPGCGLGVELVEAGEH